MKKSAFESDKAWTPRPTGGEWAAGRKKAANHRSSDPTTRRTD